MKYKIQKITSQNVTSNQLQILQPTILIFDSGVGGLSVYDEIRKLLTDLHYIYAFDNDAFPYGEKTEDFIIERIIRFFDKIQQKYALSVAIIACNTASTVGLPILRKYFNFPIIGVVPAIKLATQLTCNGIIGLLATNVTVRGSYIRKLKAKFAFDCHVEMIASSELVKLAEQKLHGCTISTESIEQIINPWLKMKKSPDTIVLGCTHFPLLLKELQTVLFAGTRLIDSGSAIARRVMWLINHHKHLIVTNSKNIAFCTKMDVDAQKLILVLRNKGFSQLEKISI